MLEIHPDSLAGRHHRTVSTAVTSVEVLLYHRIVIRTHLLRWGPVQPLRQPRTVVQHALSVAGVVFKVTLVVTPDAFVVLTAVTVMVVVTVLVLLRVAVTGFEIMVGVAWRVLVVAGVSLFVENSVWVVEGRWTWRGRERGSVNTVGTGDGAVVAVGGGVGGA